MTPDTERLSDKASYCWAAVIVPGEKRTQEGFARVASVLSQS